LMDMTTYFMNKSTKSFDEWASKGATQVNMME
jgi:hypothetical protein